MGAPVDTVSVRTQNNYCEVELDKLQKSYKIEGTGLNEAQFEAMLCLAQWINAFVMHLTGRSYQLTNRKLSDGLEVVSVGLQNTYGGKMGKVLTVLAFAVGATAVFCSLSAFIAYVRVDLVPI